MLFLLTRKPVPSFGSTLIRRPIVWHFRKAAHILPGSIRASSLVALLVVLSSVTVGDRQATMNPPIVDPGALKLPVALDVRAERDLASFRGTVKDDEDQLIAAATLRLRDLASGREVAFKTDNDGSFSKRGLEPSDYALTVEKAGYQRARGKLSFRAGEVKRLNFWLAAPPGGKAFQRGDAAFNAGEYLEAARWFEESVRLSPDLAEAHTNLGLAYVGLSRIEEGIRELEQAVSLDPAQGQAEFHVAMAYGEAGQTQEALLRLGKCFFKKDDPARASQYFTRVITVSPETRQAREARAFLKKLKSRR